MTMSVSNLSEERFQRDHKIVLACLRKAHAAGEADVYMRQIVDRTGLDQAHARRVAIEMEARGMVSSRMEGSGPKIRKWYRVRA